MKKVLSVLLLVCMLLSFSGAALAADDDALRAYEGTTINVMLENHPASTAIKELVPEFEEMTGIKVNCEILPYEEMPAKILLAFSQGSSDYDIVMNDSLSMSGYVANDYIYALDDFVANDAINQFVDLDDFVPTYIDTMKRDGVLYGLPVYGESTFLMYRKDLFEEYNLEVPSTMEELIECAKTIYEATDGEIAGITMRGQQGIHVLYTWSGFLWGNGGRWFDEDGMLDLDSPEAIEAAQVYADLLNNYGPLGYAPVPAFADAKQYGGQHSLAVHPMYLSKFSPNPEAAFLFMSWAMSPETQSKSMEIEPHSGVTSLSAMESDAFQELYGAFKDGMLAALAEANPNYTPQNEQAQEIISRVGAAMSEVLAGTKTAEEALTKVNEEVNTEVLGG